jgi:hypothetical protein
VLQDQCQGPLLRLNIVVEVWLVLEQLLRHHLRMDKQLELLLKSALELLKEMTHQAKQLLLPNQHQIQAIVTLQS